MTRAWRIVFTALVLSALTACSHGTSPTPQPARVTLSGTVYAAASQRSIQDVRVQIVDGPNVGRVTMTNGAGRYEFANLVAGMVTLRFSSSGYLDLQRTENIQSDTALDVYLDRGPEPGFVLSGVVTTQWGEPIDDVGVEAVHDGRVFGGGTTNRSGVYSIPTLPAQDYIVRAIKWGYRTPQLPLVLSANATLNIVLDRVRIEVSGFVDEAQPCIGTIIGARIEVIDGPDAGVSITSTSAGYRLENLNWGTFRLRASRSGYEPAEATVDAPPPGSGSPPATAIVRVHFRLKRLSPGC